MLSDYVSIKEVLEIISEAAGNQYNLIQGKKILFEAKLENGKSVALCTPQSKYHLQGFYWCDMTTIQCDLLDQYDSSLIIFRLQGRKMMMLKWSDLKPLFTSDCMRINSHEGTHWKMHIFDEYIKVNGNPVELKTRSFYYLPIKEE